MMFEDTWEVKLKDVVEVLMDIYVEKWDDMLRELLEDFR